MNKDEILQGIETVEINCWDFEHQYDGYKRAYAKCRKYIETENCNIILELEEEIRWDNDGTDFVPVSITVVDLLISNEDNKNIEIHITDKEILKTLGL